jgi:hypothetical protein
MWSRIQGTELATEAYILMNENAINGCEYHNNDHIQEMYQYLEDTNEPYDEALDWAVMFHDIVYDKHPDKEYRSAVIFSDMKAKYRGCDLNLLNEGHVAALIMATTNHIINYTSYSPIIRADLHALTDKVRTTQNFVKIMNESMKLYGCTIEEFATNNIQFMAGLKDRVAVNSSIDIEHKMFYIDVMKGIDLTIRLAEAIKGVE